MNDAIRAMVEGYECTSSTEYTNALRDILQRLALLGLWRSKFFEHAAFYGGTALRMLHGLDRFSEDLDFSLLESDRAYSMMNYATALRREIAGFGFEVELESSGKATGSQIDSAFLKADTYRQLVAIEVDAEVLQGVHPGRLIKIKLEVDTYPPVGFETETRYVFQPIPFPVRTYTLPDLFAGKLHAVLCRKWEKRVKGRDWYDMVWYAGHYPKVRLRHLEARMRQSGDYCDDEELSMPKLRALLAVAIDDLDINLARDEVSRFIRDPRALDVWSREFFRETVQRIIPV